MFVVDTRTTTQVNLLPCGTRRRSKKHGHLVVWNAKTHGAAEWPRRYLSRRLRRGAAGIAAGEQAAAEKSTFQRTVAVHAAAAETGGFAGGVKPGHDLAVAAEHAGVEVGLETAQRLAGQDVELDRDQRAVGGIENAVRLGGADQ